MNEKSWKAQLRNRITDARGLSGRFNLSADETAFFEKRAHVPAFEFQVTPYYAGRTAGDDPDDPVRKQFVPNVKEFEVMDYETVDPLCEKRFEPVSCLVHRYGNRALFRVTTLCAVYCRFCFRRGIIGERKFTAGPDEIDGVVRYCAAHREIEELLLSGGDPLVLDDDAIAEIFERVRSARPDIIIRVCTRTPVVLPQRITGHLVGLLGRHAPVWVVTHFNHPAELSDESCDALRTLVSGGVPVLNQTVLLRGINDDATVLASLCTGLVRTGVKPYYLFQGDLAPGTAHFRVPIERGVEIHRRLAGMLSGMALPSYAVDLPDGGGKVPVRPPFLAGREDGWYRFTGPDGGSFRYPDER